MTTCGSLTDLLYRRSRARSDRLVKPQLAVILQRLLRAHQRAGRNVEPIDEPRQQKAQRRATANSGIARFLASRQRTHLLHTRATGSPLVTL